MLGRTHEIAAVGAVTSTAILFPVVTMTAETATISFLVALIGGLTPDLDKPGSKIWANIPAGGCFSRIINPFFVGGHRHLTHSLLGMLMFGFIARLLLGIFPLGEKIDTDIVHLSFMISFGSHIMMDMLTKGGVPLLFPLSIHFGFPPFESLRLRTNGMVERLIITPGIIIIVLALALYCRDNTLALFSIFGLK